MNLRQPPKLDYIINGLKITLIENTWLSRESINGIYISFGWGNGYVDLPKMHPMYELEYDYIPVDVHGGLTFSDYNNEYWRVGFDTAHAGDTLANWDKLAVYYETKRLAEQLSQWSKL